MTFNGEFQLEYPNEFLEELDQLQKKHNCVFFGNPVLRNLGNYVDFQKIEDTSETTQNNLESSNEEV